MTEYNAPLLTDNGPKCPFFQGYSTVTVQHLNGVSLAENVEITAEPAEVLDSRCAVTRFDIVPSEKNHDRCILPAGHAWLHDFEPADHSAEVQS
jgi:hypothetical protein